MPSSEKGVWQGNRIFVKAIKELSTSRNISFTGFSQDWIIRLKRGSVVRYVYGYNFDLNSSSAWMIANDKAGLSNLLALARLPHVEHRFFPHPRLSGYVPASGNWAAVLQFAEASNYNLVCKTNQGTGGSEVYRIQNQRELEAAFQQLFEVHRGLSLSPLYAIDQEFRLIMLQGKVLLAFEKVIPTVTGDGLTSFQTLMVQSFDAGKISAKVLSAALEEPSANPDFIPAQGLVIPILWKHNLGRGANLRILNEGELPTLQQLANDAMLASGLSLAAVDLISTKGQLRILEINCGIMLENFAAQKAGGYPRAKEVYSKILNAMFPP